MEHTLFGLICEAVVLRVALVQRLDDSCWGLLQVVAAFGLVVQRCGVAAVRLLLAAWLLLAVCSFWAVWQLLAVWLLLEPLVPQHHWN